LGTYSGESLSGLLKLGDLVELVLVLVRFPRMFSFRGRELPLGYVMPNEHGRSGIAMISMNTTVDI
jgi:hypothetical protein